MTVTVQRQAPLIRRAKHIERTDDKMSANERPVAEVVETYGLDDSDEKLKLEIVGGLWLLLYEAVATGWSRFIGLLRSLPAATKAIFTAIDGGLSLKEE